MSSRQKQRLKKQLLQAQELTPSNEASSSESEAEEEASICARAKSVFALMNDSDSEERSSDKEDDDGLRTEDTSNEISLKKESAKKKKANKPKKAKKKIVYDEKLENLARQIESVSVANAESASSSSTSSLNKLLQVDDKCLDVDRVMRKRFGARVLAGDDEEKGPIGGKRHMKLAGNRRLLFGLPKEDWSKSPSIVGGGYSIVRDEFHPTYYSELVNRGIGGIPVGSWFRIECSPEYERLCDTYRAVQDSGDANQLVMFLSRYPYHLDGLLQLAMVFARTGQMDRASDLVRRCIFCIEMAFSENFHPSKGVGHRMDPTQEENCAVFNALFRHMQLTNMLGCPGVASDIGIFLYSLCPEGDPMGVLLLLDYLFVCAGRFDDLVSWTGVSRDPDHDMWKLSTQFPMLSNINGLWLSPIEIGVSPYTISSWQASLSSSSTGASFSATAQEAETMHLWCLPNWSFSLALAAFNEELRVYRQGQEHVSTQVAPNHQLSSSMLSCALLRWPFVLNMLVTDKKAGIEAKSINWRNAMGSQLFSNAIDRLPKGSVLQHISRLYVTRSASLWNRDEVHQWLVASAVTVAEFSKDVDVIGSQNSAYLLISAKLALQKYLSALEEDFLEDFPRFPPEANPLDPRFADPRLLARQVVPRRQARQAVGMDVVEGQHVHEIRRNRRLRPANQPIIDDDGGIDDRALEYELGRLREQGINITPEELILQYRQFAGPANAEVGNGLEVDLDAPLMQLFLQTLMPWYNLPQNSNGNNT